MKELDEIERKIVRELIRNPRLSDNKISKKTRIPVMTVNRRRKGLEGEGYLRYFTSLDTGEHGTGKYEAKQLYVIKFKIGITRKEFMEKVESVKEFVAFSSHYISLSCLGEKDGHLAYMCVLDAEAESKLMDEFNEKLVPYFEKRFGKNCIEEITTMRVTNTLRRHHNYVPSMNMENGMMKKDWPDEYIFVDEEEKVKEAEMQKKLKESSV